jgi:organic radical activating enzyme
MRVSEVFVSVQGEGPSIGRPAVFLRLSQCNLNCVWCDTKYSWYGGVEKDVDDVVDGILRLLDTYSRVDLLVVTGGEPLLQRDELELLVRALKGARKLEVEVETNCTVDPGNLVDVVDRFIVSPKLEHSGVPEELRRCAEGFRGFSRRYQGKIYLKFVVESAEDLSEVDEIIDFFGAEPSSVYLMPQASSMEELTRKLRLVVDLAIRRGFRVSDRLQIVGGFR